MTSRTLAASVLLGLLAGNLAGIAYSQSTPSNFALHDGDRVTFYGDSITEQREYTEDVEEFVLTRYPGWQVNFHNAGVGGDKVSGGWAGPVDLRLDRDVFAWHPDVITIMLGMNDFYYRPDEPGIYSTYTEGYTRLVASMQHNNPSVRITLLQPSPYDDVTREPVFLGASNAVLVKYSAFLAQLAEERHAQVADFNSPLVAFLKKINAESPQLAQQIIPDRVHPQQGGHWIMAESLLKSWQAPSVVTSVTIDAGAMPAAQTSNTDVSDLVRPKGKIANRISWTQTDKALPLPFPSPELDPVVGLVLKYSDIITALDQETLQVHGLSNGIYDLFIDGRKIASTNSDDLVSGINLATADTPMLEQARLVAWDTEKVNNLESARFGVINTSVTAEQSLTASALATAYKTGVERQHADARPLVHHYELVLENPPPASH